MVFKVQKVKKLKKSQYLKNLSTQKKLTFIFEFGGRIFRKSPLESYLSSNVREIKNSCCKLLLYIQHVSGILLQACDVMR